MMKNSKSREETMTSESRSKRKSSRSSDNATKQEQKPASKTDEQKHHKAATKLDEQKNATPSKTDESKHKATPKLDETKPKAIIRKTDDTPKLKPTKLDEKLTKTGDKVRKIDDLKQISDESKAKISMSSKGGESLARKVITYEEESAVSRDSLNDLNEFRTSCKNIESLVSEINELKKSENSSHQEQLLEKRLDAMLLTTNLKKLNRLAQVRGHNAKESTLDVKKKVDSLHLELQNLLYEVMHMKKEIRKCMNFSSKDEEIDLVDVDRFYEEAPADISKPDITKNDPHQQMLARLDFELKKRKELNVKKTEYLEQKKKTESELNQKSDYLSNLKPRLDQIIKATMPVQEYMGLPIEAERLLFETAQYLPRPLYILYIQAKAFKDVCDQDMDVDIEGDLQLAIAEFNQDETESDISDIESEVENTDAGDINDKRGRKVKKENKKARLEEQRVRLLRKHPLAVHIILKNKDKKYNLSLVFYHLPLLHINTVKVKFITDDKSIENSSLLSSDSVLYDLLTRDSGKDSPNSANKYQLEKLHMKDLSSELSSVGKPYYWVQWICGLNYLPNEDIRTYVPDSSFSVKHFQSVIRTIRSRIATRLILYKQLQQLEELTIPVSTNNKKERHPAKTVCVLASWKPIYYEDFLVYPSAKELVDCGLVTEDCLFFSARLTREENLDIGIVIHTNYPQQPPLFLLTMKDNNRPAVKIVADLLCLEREINTHTDEQRTCEPDLLLSTRLRKLQVCFDMFVETGAHRATKEKLYTRKTRGRDRNRPYVYHSDGYFVHR